MTRETGFYWVRRADDRGEPRWEPAEWGNDHFLCGWEFIGDNRSPYKDHELVEIGDFIPAPAAPSSPPQSEVVEAIAELRELAGQIDPCMVGGKDALLLKRAAALIERLATGGGEREDDVAFERECFEAAAERIRKARGIPTPEAPADLDERAMLLNLLAVVHRDGGHYVEQHGLQKAVEDALSLSSERIAALSDQAMIRDAALREAAAVAEKAWPRAHTYASENADLYRSQDAVRDRIVAAILSLLQKDTKHG